VLVFESLNQIFESLFSHRAKQSFYLGRNTGRKITGFLPLVWKMPDQWQKSRNISARVSTACRMM
jgi:hypothetical protein